MLEYRLVGYTFETVSSVADKETHLMRLTRNTRQALCLIACLMLVGRLAGAADWPAYRGNSARTGKTSEKLQFPLSLAWKYVPARKHQPAWPDPFLIRGRGKNFDAAPQTIIVGDLVCFGSTTDNTLWALDAKTGKTKWGFTTGGPVRFAPAVVDGRAFVVSDDGHVYCLDASTGKLIWKVRGGLNDRKVVGNGRVISRWPIRSGVAVKGGVVHFAAGMWSSEGVYVYALDAKSGEEIWCNDANLHYLPMPHASTAHTGNMPQGYLALGGNRVVYNNGVGGTWAYDAGAGRLTGRANGTGTLKKAKGGDYKDYKPSKFYNWSLLILNDKSGQTLFHGATEGTAEASGLVPLHAALAGDTLIKCVGDKVVAMDNSGKGVEIWRHAIEGGASGVAVAGGRLVISSTDGAIYCFKHGAAGKPAVVGPGSKTTAPIKPAPDNRTAAVLTELARRKVNRGFALMLGQKDARFAQALTVQTQLQVICLLTDKSAVDAERKRLRDSTDLYGARVTVEHWSDTAKLPYAQYFANLIVVTDRPEKLLDVELARVQRPCGGILIQGDKVTVRGKLPGALDWDSKVTSDQRLGGLLELLWFGEPGPTHATKITPSTAAGGRLFVFGPNGSIVTAVDAYNGTVLWRRKVARNEKRISADDRYLYVGKLVLDAQSGQVVDGSTGPKPLRLTPRRSEADEEKYLTQRRHPLTGGLSSKAHDRLHGCSSWASSASMEFFRSSTIAYYDYEDDSGIRNFGGLRPGCGDSLLPAMGLLLYGESTGVPHGAKGSSCSCAYSYKTSLALAPAEHRRNEDWAVFQDIPQARSGGIRHAAINCGAPGDRRDDDKKLWLAAPRPQGPSGWSIYRDFTFTLPYKPEFHGEHRYFRGNSDRLKIDRTDRPWLYVSGYLGIKRLTWELDYYNRYHQCLSLPVAKAPSVDGRLDEACWSGAAELFQPYTPPRHKDQLPPHYADPIEAAYARHDEDNLYLAYRKRLVADRRGKIAPVKASTKGRDAPVWEDSSFELFLSDGSGDTIIHLGVSASGAAYDSLLKFPPLPKDPKAAKQAIAKSVPKRNTGWNGDWTSKVRSEKELLAAEISIPWKMLNDLGVNKNDLRINLAHTRTRWARKPFTRKAHASSRRLDLSGTKPGVKLYTVRLHFAEPTCRTAGQRVFDVILGDKVVLKDFDVFAETGGKNKALVKEIRGVPATRNIVLEFIPAGEKITDANAPILCGLEIVAEKPGKLPDPVSARLIRSRGGHKRFLLHSEIEKLSDKAKEELEKARRGR
jgi:outer membrane protein assembly factor BamB